MTLEQVQKKALRLIEEISDEENKLTDDPDIEKKLNDVTNQVMFELCRLKKILATDTREVAAGEVLDLMTLENFFQLKLLRCKNEAGEDVSYELIDNLAIFEGAGTAAVFYYRYPKAITFETIPSEYEFELPPEVLEIMPYGIAADLLKSDVSTNYGKIYAERYEAMKQMLDPRYSTGSISIEGGVDI